MSLFHRVPAPADADRPIRGGAPLGRRVLLAAAVVSAGLCVTAVLPAAAGASAASAAAATTSLAATHTVSLATSSTARSYWTPARLQTATVADIATAPATGAVTSGATRGRPAGPARQADPIPPSGSGAVASGPVKLSGATTNSWTYLGVPESQYTSYPYRVNGKIFFTFKGGSYVCSGTSVTAYVGSTPRSEVWTAGHCLSNTDKVSPNTWTSNVIFVPAYNGRYSDPASSMPFGAFPLTQASVGWNWLTKADFGVDLGAFTVGTSDRTGLTLVQAVGAAGFRWNWSATQTFDMFGYPSAAPYDGRFMYHYRATTAGRDGSDAQAPIMTDNPMTAGSSGGAWSTGWSTTSTGWINGHNDYKRGTAQTMYSPYFGDTANAVRCFNASTC